jgi:hypothetical protein
MNDGNECEAKENPGVLCASGSILGASNAAPHPLGRRFSPSTRGNLHSAERPADSAKFHCA